jgi:hypothetical protein
VARAGTVDDDDGGKWPLALGKEQLPGQVEVLRRIGE